MDKTGFASMVLLNSELTFYISSTGIIPLNMLSVGRFAADMGRDKALFRLAETSRSLFATSRID